MTISEILSSKPTCHQISRLHILAADGVVVAEPVGEHVVRRPHLEHRRVQVRRHPLPQEGIVDAAARQVDEACVRVDDAARESDGQVQARVGVGDDAAEGGAGDLLDEAAAAGVEDGDRGAQLVDGDEEAAGVGGLHGDEEAGVVVVKPENKVGAQFGKW